MKWLANLFGGGITEPIEAIGGIIDDLHTSGEEKAAAKIVMTKLRQNPLKMQAAINAIQAQHRSMFVAGGRPFIIWVCGFALLYMWPIRMLISDIAFLIGGGALPELAVTAADVTALLAPILGLGLLRSGEKAAKVTK